MTTAYYDRVFARMLKYRLSVIFFLAGIIAVTQPGMAQAIDAADIDAQLSAIASRYGEDDPTRERLQRIYANARDLIQAGQHHEQVASEFEQAIKRGPETLQALRSQLLTLEQQASRAVVNRREKALAAAEVERLYRQAESRRTTLEDALFAIEDEQRALIERPEQIRQDRESSTARIAALELALRLATDAPSNDLSNAEKTVIEVELASLRSALRRLDGELLSHPARLELARAKHGLAVAELEVQARRTTELQDLLLGRRRDTANSLIEKAMRAQDDAASSHPLVRQIINENVEFGRELSRVIESQPEVADQGAQLEAQHVALGKEYERAQDRLKYVGYGNRSWPPIDRSAPPYP